MVLSPHPHSPDGPALSLHSSIGRGAWHASLEAVAVVGSSSSSGWQ